MVQRKAEDRPFVANGEVGVNELAKEVGVEAEVAQLLAEAKRLAGGERRSKGPRTRAVLSRGPTRTSGAGPRAPDPVGWLSLRALLSQ